MSSLARGASKRIRVRSCAYIIHLNTYSKHELDYLQAWIRERCIHWIIAHRIYEGIPAADVYLRFKNTVALSVISGIIRGAPIDTSTVSFGNMFSKYTSDKQFTQIETSEMPKATKSLSAKHAEIATLLDSKCDRGGNVIWCNYQNLNSGYQDLIRYLTSRDDIIITKNDEQGVYSIIQDEIVQRKRATKAMILIPKVETALNYDYVMFLDEIRSGVIGDYRYRSGFPPMNVMVISRSFVKKLMGEDNPLPMEIHEIYL